MLLALDVGNTHTVVGVFDGGGAPAAERAGDELTGLVHCWRVATVPERTADELALLLVDLLRLEAIELPRQGPRSGGSGEISGLAVSSSVPAVTGALRAMVDRFFEFPLVVVEPGIRTGMPIRYDDPREVGADRISNAVGALDLFGAPAVIVDLGTATTFDVLSGAGEYLGGVIVPGLEISMDALFAHAARLPRVELAAPREVIGRSTVESMQAGAIFGHAALIDGLAGRILAELGEATVVVTGGLAPLVAPHLARVDHLAPWLTLHGLRLLYEQNRPEEQGHP